MARYCDAITVGHFTNSPCITIMCKSVINVSNMIYVCVPLLTAIYLLISTGNYWALIGVRVFFTAYISVTPWQ